MGVVLVIARQTAVARHRADSTQMCRLLHLTDCCIPIAVVITRFPNVIRRFWTVAPDTSELSYLGVQFKTTTTASLPALQPIQWCLYQPIPPPHHAHMHALMHQPIPTLHLQ